jgi:hypothetical protein
MQTMIEIILCTNIFKYALNNTLQALNFGARQSAIRDTHSYRTELQKIWWKWDRQGIGIKTEDLLPTDHVTR